MSVSTDVQVNVDRIRESRDVFEIRMAWMCHFSLVWPTFTTSFIKLRDVMHLLKNILSENDHVPTCTILLARKAI